jgi:hypothetical protein
MVPLDEDAIAWTLGHGEAEGRPVSLSHALIHRRPGLWGDHPRRPRSVVLVREGTEGEGWHAFGLGEAEPAVGWLARRRHRVSLLAPTTWEGAIRRRGSAVARGVVETWAREGVPAELDRPPPPIARLLDEGDARAFARAMPAWALRAWGSFAAMIREGAAFGVPDRDGRLASVAWVFEADHERDSLAVATDARYQRLGLGRAAGTALVEHIEGARRKAAIWTVADANLPSKALARSLGFSPRAREVVLRWEP